MTRLQYCRSSFVSESSFNIHCAGRASHSSVLCRKVNYHQYAARARQVNRARDLGSWIAYNLQPGRPVLRVLFLPSSSWGLLLLSLGEVFL